MEQPHTGQNTEIPVPFAPLHGTCPDMMQQLGTGAISITLIYGIILLIRELTNLVKAKSA